MNSTNEILKRIYEILNSMKVKVDPFEDSNEISMESLSFTFNEEYRNDLLLLASLLTIYLQSPKIDMTKHIGLFEGLIDKNSFDQLKKNHETHIENLINEEESPFKGPNFEIYEDDSYPTEEESREIQEAFYSRSAEFYENQRFEMEYAYLELLNPYGITAGNKKISCRTWSYYFFFKYLNNETRADCKEKNEIPASIRQYLIEIWGNSSLYNSYLKLNKTVIKRGKINKLSYREHVNSLENASHLLKLNGYPAAASEAKLMYDNVFEL